MVQRFCPGWRPIRVHTSTQAGRSRLWRLQMRDLMHMDPQGCECTHAPQRRHSLLTCPPGRQLGSAHLASEHQLPDQQSPQYMAATVQRLRHLPR